jgi:hypothetical protein
MGFILIGSPAMCDEEDQETPLQETDGHQLAAQTAWVRLLIRELRKRGYTIEDVVALLDDPEMTVEAAAERILSTKGSKAN